MLLLLVKKVVKTKHAASIEDHGHSEDLKKRTVLVFESM